MARAIVWLVSVAWASLAAAQPPPARDNPPVVGAAIIRGRVTDAGSERPLPRVEIRAVSGPLRVNKAAVTDADGRYEIRELPAGKFTVTALKANYVRAAYGQSRPLGPGQPVEVANGATVARIDFVLQHTGVITGRIVDEYGDPAIDTQVTPMRYAFVNGERRLQPAGMGSSTNDLGEYRVYGLAPGQYLLGAVLRNGAFGSFGASTEDRSAYVPTYYPGTGNTSEAQRLTVAPGQTITGINLTLLPVTAARVSGVVLDSQGRPLAGGFVNLMPRNGPMPFGPAGNGPVTANGEFRIDGVAPGDYTIRATPQGFSGPNDDFAMQDISVNGDVTDLQLTVTKGSVLRGRLAFEPGSAAPPAPTVFRITAMAPGGPMGPAGNATAKDDGTFEIKSRGGHLNIRLAAGPGGGDWRLKRVLVGDADVIDTGLDVPPNATVDNLVLELTTKRAEIAAGVSDGSGAAVRDCVVVLFARDPSRWVPQTRYFAVGRPDAEAVFHSQPPAGDYFVVAFADTETNLGIFADPEILMQLRDRATPVSLPEGDVTKVQLKLVEPPVY